MVNEWLNVYHKEINYLKFGLFDTVCISSLIYWLVAPFLDVIHTCSVAEAFVFLINSAVSRSTSDLLSLLSKAFDLLFSIVSYLCDLCVNNNIKNYNLNCALRNPSMHQKMHDRKQLQLKQEEQTPKMGQTTLQTETQETKENRR